MYKETNFCSFLIRICDDLYSSNLTVGVDPTSRSSIMFSAESPNVVMFCDEGNHNRYIPTKQNHLCGRQSTLDVILKHADFIGKNLVDVSPVTIVDTTPTFVYKRRRTTRYVLVIDETRDMQIRESWNYLRSAVRKWVHYDLPVNTEVGVVLANGTASDKILPIAALNQERNRDLVSSFIPYSPSDSSKPGCLNCAIKDAIQMLKERNDVSGIASSVIVVVAPGMDYNTDHHLLSSQANANRIRIVTINYPDVSRLQPLDILATKTDGSSYTVFERKQNKDDTYLVTYFDLTNTLFNIGRKYYEGNPSKLLVEIHRREIVDMVDESSKNRVVTGSFMLDSTMGEPASFFIYTHKGEYPMISTFTLTSPNGVTYSTRSDLRLPVKQLTIQASINETGSWTYTILRDNGNPQPHYVQVLATPRSSDANVISARAWIKRSAKGGPIRLFAEVKKGDLPIRSAHVEVTMTNFHCNVSSFECSRKFRLLDTGSGDPDITKGDGIYSRYFSASETGPGVYNFEVSVTDNGNTAYSLSDDALIEEERSFEPCCGSIIHTPSKQPLPPFQRILPNITIFVSKEQILNDMTKLMGKIGDLKSELVDGGKVRLSWTSPDLGGYVVARYEVKYATAIQEIVDNFETAAVLWTHNQAHPYSIGDETSFTLNMTNEPSLIGRPLYFAIRAYSQLAADAAASEVSNYVRVFVPKPTVPTQATPAYSLDHGFSSWPFDTSNDEENMIPKIAKKIDFGPELIIPIIGGIILLLLLACMYCYCCIIRRRSTSSAEDKKKSIKSSLKAERQTVNVIVPSPAHNNNSINGNLNSLKPIDQMQSTPQYEGLHDHIQDAHTIGLPIYNIDEEMMGKNRYSLVHHQEQQLIEELKTQQQHVLQSQYSRQDIMQTPNNFGNGLSVISSNTNTLTRNGRTLSPYESWSASQLLHEHERRHSPTDDVMGHHNMGHHVPQPHEMDPMLGNDQMMLLNGGNTLQHPSDCVSLSGMSNHHAPPVPPLPYSANDYQQGYNIYSTTTGNGISVGNQPPPMYSAIQRNPNPGATVNGQNGNGSFNTSLQGSLNSVNSNDKKRRNVTMV